MRARAVCRSDLFFCGFPFRDSALGAERCARSRLTAPTPPKSSAKQSSQNRNGDDARQCHRDRSHGRLVTGLEQDNFRVFEDGVEQEIVNFSSQDVPVSIGVIFDMSGSMRRQDRKVAPRRRAIFPHRESAGRIFPGRFQRPRAADQPVHRQRRRIAESPDVHVRPRPDGLARRNLPRLEPDERSTQHKESFAHHIRWRR